MNKFLKGLKESLQINRDSVALIDENNQFTYFEVDRLSSLLAAEITQYTKGGTEKPVIIFMERSVYFVVSILAILKAGCFYIPIERPFPSERLRLIKEEVNCNIFIIDNKSLDDLRGIEFQDELFIINPLTVTKTVSIQQWQDKTDDYNLCYTIYTSGTTGKPKGVCIQYDSLYNLVQSLYEVIYRDIPKYSRVALIASFSFDASVKQIFCSLYFGHTLVISDKDTKYFGRKLLNFYKKWSVYLSDITPTLIKNIVLQINETTKCNVQYFLIGGEVLTWECVHDFIEKIGYFPKLINLYGPTECCVDVSYYTINVTTNKFGPVPIGKSIKNVQLNLVDENGEDVGETIGELMVTGICVARGYVDQNIDKKFGVSALHGNVRTYKTGDIARREPDGNYIIFGRNDDQIKINGNRVELSEIESIIIAHPLVQACSVIFYKNKLYCLIVSKHKETLGLQKYLKQHLPKYMIPTHLLPLDSLPINQNGKIDREFLQDLIKGKTRKFILLKDW